MSKVVSLQKAKKTRKRGFTLIEMILVLAALAMFLGVIFAIYKTKVEPTRWAQNKFQIMQSVVAAIENAKSANGGAYPAATGVDLGSTTAPTDDKAKLVWYAVTGGRPTPDIQGWQYSCDNSTDTLDLVVDISDKPSDAAAGVFKASVENNLGWQVVSGDETQDTITFEKANVICN